MFQAAFQNKVSLRLYHKLQAVLQALAFQPFAGRRGSYTLLGRSGSQRMAFQKIKRAQAWKKSLGREFTTNLIQPADRHVSFPK